LQTKEGGAIYSTLAREVEFAASAGYEPGHTLGTRLVVVVVLLVAPGEIVLLILLVALIEVAVVFVVIGFPAIVVDDLVVIPSVIVVVVGIVDATAFDVSRTSREEHRHNKCR
jgi:hypothetical protein